MLRTNEWDDSGVQPVRTAFWKNPFFRRELGRRERWLSLAALFAVNAAYVLAFESARRQAASYVATRAFPGLTSAFRYEPWLYLGGVLLSVSAHWLMPLSIHSLLRRKYDLRALEWLGRGRGSDKDALLGQVTGTLFPLIIGTLPLLLLLPLLARGGEEYLLPISAAYLTAVLWGALTSGVSIWTGVVCRSSFTALWGSYALICLVLPLVVAVTAGLVAYGCAAGRSNAGTVFLTAGLLTWSLLVTGLAATFWDVTLGRLFPSPYRCLWVETPLDCSPER